MSAWDKLIYSVVFIALVAVVVSTKETPKAIGAIGAAAVKLAQNIVGVPKQG